MATTDRGVVITDTTEGPDRAPPSRRLSSVASAHRSGSTVSMVEGDVEGIRTRRWTPESAIRASVVFCHGFMTQPRDYEGLMRLIASRGIDVVAPEGHRRDLRALTGRRTVDEEIRDVERVVSAVDPTVVVGHSRGGLVAWIIGGDRPRRAVVAIDPVLGDARRGPAVRFDPRRVPARALVVGAERPGRCAPVGFNDRTLAAATAPDHRFPTMPGTHAIVRMGHADLLDPLARCIGGALCGGKTEAQAVQATVAALIALAAIGGAPVGEGAPSGDDVGGDLLPIEWSRHPA